MKGEIVVEEGRQRLIYFSDVYKDLSLEDFNRQIPWRQNEIRIFGKTHLEPRLTAWCGPAYKYSSIQWPESPWIPILEQLKTELITQTGFEFNAVLCNLYREGTDSMGWHSDDEKEIDSHLIASVSLGAERVFRIRKKGSSTSQGILLEHGSLLLMEDFQQKWQHCIPRSKKVENPRLNLTFRRIMTEKRP